jgi:DNA-binding transcriptional MerR regulator
MQATRTFSVREFASAAGVTVRTLHYYDEAGLLKPSAYTNANHRRYHQEDMLRLQQILMLKYMGFSLREIQNLLSSPAYDLRKSLEIQKAAVDQRISKLQQVSRALEQTLDALSALEENDFDWERVRFIIQAVAVQDKADWMRQYYSDAALQKIAARAEHYSMEQAMADFRRWEQLTAEFQSRRHLAPNHPDVQTLAALMWELIQEFTQGDPEVRAGLSAMYQNYGEIPDEYKLHNDPDLHQFMNDVFRIYEERRQKP